MFVVLLGLYSKIPTECLHIGRNRLFPNITSNSWNILHFIRLYITNTAVTALLYTSRPIYHMLAQRAYSVIFLSPCPDRKSVSSPFLPPRTVNVYGAGNHDASRSLQVYTCRRRWRYRLWLYLQRVLECLLRNQGRTKQRTMFCKLTYVLNWVIFVSCCWYHNCSNQSLLHFLAPSSIYTIFR